MAQQAGSPSRVYGVDFSAQQTSLQISPQPSPQPECFSYHGPDWQFEELRLSLQGLFQRDNAATALATLECVQARFPVSPTQLRHGLQSTVWPGRFQIVSDQPLVILDGAHNPQAITALIAALPAVLHGRRVTFLFGVMQDKDWRAMLPALATIADEMVVTRVHQGRAEDPQRVQDAFSAWCPTRVMSDARTACQSIMSALGSDTALVVCGSLFLVGEVISLFPAALAPSVGCVESDVSAAPLRRNGG
jgi:dihydrofolate synthase/folylpolyglutamate synthase